MELLKAWVETINPSNERYMFEHSNGTQSLNAILPAYFYELDEAIDTSSDLHRRLVSIPYDSLVIILQSLRVLILLSGLYVLFYRSSQRDNASLYFFWEFSYLALATVLIFPHQQKYAMLYFVPAGAYMVLFILLVWKSKWKVKTRYKIIAVLSSSLMLVSALMGRDILGDYIVDVFDYYHYFGLVNIVFLVFLLLVRPDHLMKCYYIPLKKQF
jgi:hypothetical protein